MIIITIIIDSRKDAPGSKAGSLARIADGIGTPRPQLGSQAQCCTAICSAPGCLAPFSVQARQKKEPPTPTREL